MSAVNFSAIEVLSPIESISIDPIVWQSASGLTWRAASPDPKVYRKYTDLWPVSGRLRAFLARSAGLASCVLRPASGLLGELGQPWRAAQETHGTAKRIEYALIVLDNDNATGYSLGQRKAKAHQVELVGFRVRALAGALAMQDCVNQVEERRQLGNVAENLVPVKAPAYGFTHLRSPPFLILQEPPMRTAVLVFYSIISMSPCLPCGCATH